MTIKILTVVGARPNFMKAAPFLQAIAEHNKTPTAVSTNAKPVSVASILLHTGQHYDDNMSAVFFQELGIPRPEIDLGVGSGTHAEQVGRTMIAFEKVLLTEKPDWVVVVGDVNATLACSLTARKLGIKVGHIEAGLRSGDLSMPEEINRLVTDRLADLLLTPDAGSSENLYREGLNPERIVLVGNIMIDTLEANLEKSRSLEIGELIVRKLKPGQVSATERLNRDFLLLTLHRPANVDSRKLLESLVDFLLREVAQAENILWPLHPRCAGKLAEYGLLDKVAAHPGILLLEPLSYLETLRLNLGARAVLTDSGGLQEECTVLGTPCLTLRANTERPLTLVENGGTCRLVGNDPQKIRPALAAALSADRRPFRPPLWDGHTAQRCLQAILSFESKG